MAYNLYTDKPNKFNCNIEIEGTSLAKSKVRLVVETDEMSYMFNGTIENTGICEVNIPKTKHFLSEGTKGNMRLEVIADDVYFEKRSVQEYTLKKQYPPNPEIVDDYQWENSFSKNFKYDIKLNKNNFTENDYDFWAIIFHDENGQEVYRKDATEEEINLLMSKNELIIKRNFLTYSDPKTWTVWAHSKSKEWLEKITGSI